MKIYKPRFSKYQIPDILVEVEKNEFEKSKPSIADITNDNKYNERTMNIGDFILDIVVSFLNKYKAKDIPTNVEINIKFTDLDEVPLYKKDE